VNGYRPEFSQALLEELKLFHRLVVPKDEFITRDGGLFNSHNTALT
jgi:hypothetical protein